VDPYQRAKNAVAAGKYASTEAWAAAIVVSDNPKIPPEWKTWAREHLNAQLGPRAWVWLLAARKGQGERLAECQHRAISQLLDDRFTTQEK